MSALGHTVPRPCFVSAVLNFTVWESGVACLFPHPGHRLQHSYCINLVRSISSVWICSAGTRVVPVTGGILKFIWAEVVRVS